MKALVSGNSPSLTRLLEHCFRAAPWLTYQDDHLAIDWSLALSHWQRAAIHQLQIDPRVEEALRQLLPTLPLFLFATTAPTPNFFQGDERTAGLTLTTHPLPTQLMRYLDEWGTEVDRFRALLNREIKAAEEHGNNPYRDGWILRTVATAESLVAAVAFHQTLNVGFNLTTRLCVAAADMRVFLNGATRFHNYEKPNPAHRQEVWEELRHLRLVRLDLLKQIGERGESPSSAQDLMTTIQALARRERTLFKLLNGPMGSAGGMRSDRLLTQKPGYAVATGDGLSLPYDLSPYASSGSMIRRFVEDELQDIPLPPPHEMLLTAIRQTIPNPYALTSKHVSQEGVEGARVFAAATERIQTQLRRADTEEIEHAASVDRETLVAVEMIDEVLQWVLAETPLVTLLLSGFLATYRQGEQWGLCLSPWVVADSLSVSVLGVEPQTYFREPKVEAEPVRDGTSDFAE